MAMESITAGSLAPGTTGRVRIVSMRAPTAVEERTKHTHTQTHKHTHTHKSIHTHTTIHTHTHKHTHTQEREREKVNYEDGREKIKRNKETTQRPTSR